mmetsp:Transcript_44376/g.107331  ORF Transcript_44376/g.107331 Transcript_44376/m.107331 type:complete len:1428 (-) Transcript_44376:31-4314(-)
MHSTPVTFPGPETTITTANIASLRSRRRRSETSVDDDVDDDILQTRSSSSIEEEEEDPSITRSRRRQRISNSSRSRSRRKRSSIVVFAGALLITEAILNFGLEVFFGGDNREMISSTSRHRYLYYYYTQAFQRQPQQVFIRHHQHCRHSLASLTDSRTRAAVTRTTTTERQLSHGLHGRYQRFNGHHGYLSPALPICTRRLLTTRSSTINDHDSDNSQEEPLSSSSSPFVSIPEVSGVEDDFGFDGFHFEEEEEFILPPLDENQNDMSSLPSFELDYDSSPPMGPVEGGTVDAVSIYPTIPPPPFDNDYDNEYIDDRMFSGHPQHPQQQQRYPPTNQKYTMSEERRAQNLVKKRDFLLQDLNPSQIDAVTQPVPEQSPFHKFQQHQQQQRTELSTSVPFVGSELGIVPDVSTSTGDAVITRVIAGPGSGKTRVLTSRIIHLLQEDPNQGRVLAVTFTRKAAGEMKERVERMLQELEELERGKDDDGRNGRNNDDVVRLDRYGEVIVAEETYGKGSNNEVIKPQPRGLERVELGTFHSVCAKIMRYNGDLLCDLPSVRRDMSKAAPVEVSPGTSADEGTADGGMSFGLVDALANLNGQFAIVDQAEQIRIVKECLKELDVDLKTLDVKPIELLSAISDIREKFAQNEDPFEDKNKRRPGMGRKQSMARKIYYPYREKLLANNAVDFDDLIFMTREMLMEHQELRERLHCRWPHVLVDEFQDTSKTQMDLVKLLTSSSLFVVGDADQSIYSWRGAHVRSLHDVKPEFEPYGEVRTVFLKENYRSTSNIVKAAEKVISAGGNWKQPSFSLDDEDSDVNGDERSNDDIRRAMTPKRGLGPSPRIIACADERAEATFVVETVLNMTTRAELKPSSTVAMIYRTNAQSRYLEEACVDNNLPYVIRGGAGGFYKRAEIKDSLCFLRWLYNGDDEGSMLRAFKTPSKGIGEKAIAEFRTYVDKVQEYYRRFRPLNQRPTPLDILTSIASNQTSPDGFTLLVDGAPEPGEYISKRALTKFKEFGLKMGDIRTNALSMTVDKLLFDIIEELKLIDHFDAISKTKTEFADRKENVQELRQAAKKYGTYGPALKPRSAASMESNDDNFMDGDSALGIFLDDVALVSDAAEAEGEEKEGKGNERLVVNLMTIHASKGTEFDAVFVVGCEEGTLPCSPSLQDGESQQLEEERRLCYVAMTRAKTNLVLTWRKEVTSFSSWSDSGPKTTTKKRSRFLEALVSKKSKSKSKSKLTSDDKGRSPNPSSTKKNGSMNVDGQLRSKRRGVRNGVRQRDEQVQLQSPRDFSSTTSNPSSTGKRVVKKKKVTVPRRKNSIPSLDRIEALQSSLSSSEPARGTSKTSSSSSSPSSSSKTVGAAPSAEHLLDPSWFFPVGQAVVHRQYGKGVVLGHPPCEEIDDATVMVRFANGKHMEFPALGTDILPEM